MRESSNACPVFRWAEALTKGGKRRDKREKTEQHRAKEKKPANSSRSSRSEIYIYVHQTPSGLPQAAHRAKVQEEDRQVLQSRVEQVSTSVSAMVMINIMSNKMESKEKPFLRKFTSWPAECGMWAGLAGEVMSRPTYRSISTTGPVCSSWLYRQTVLVLVLVRCLWCSHKHMDRILHPHAAYTTEYLDDVIIYSNDRQWHIQHLSAVLRLALNLNKVWTEQRSVKASPVDTLWM